MSLVLGEDPSLTSDPAFSADEIELGRRLFLRPWQFVKGVVEIAGLPAPGPIEIAFAGRSNVGKSSLINAVTGRIGLARASNTPGRTQEINYFESPDSALFLVDLPGYGFAKAPKDKVTAWTTLVTNYLKGRQGLARVMLLMDARHGIKPVDLEIMGLLNTAAVSYQVVLTKGDKLGPAALDNMVHTTTAALSKHPAAFPHVLATSTHTGGGIDELRAAVNRLVSELRA